MLHKFKVGDRVLYENDGYSDEGTVVEVKSNGGYLIHFHNNDEVEPIESEDVLALLSLLPVQSHISKDDILMILHEFLNVSAYDFVPESYVDDIFKCIDTKNDPDYKLYLKLKEKFKYIKE
jgi:hypothetical protein